MIDAVENWDVSIFDVPGSYLWADMTKDKTVLVEFEEKFVDIISDVDPYFLDYFINEHNKKVL